MFTNTSKKVFDKDLIEIELLLNLKLPLDLRNHYLEYNGGIPSNEYYYMDEYDTFLWIDSFIPFKYENKKLKNGTIEKIYSHLVQKNALPENFIPFASDLGGNKICLDLKTDHIYIVYMDLGNPMKNPDAIREIASGFKYFVDNLEEDGEENV